VYLNDLLKPKIKIMHQLLSKLRINKVIQYYLKLKIDEIKIKLNQLQKNQQVIILFLTVKKEYPSTIKSIVKNIFSFMDNEEIIPDNVEIQVNNPPITEKAEPSL
jgi:hypothetical protein